jgi:hypothetical protein
MQIFGYACITQGRDDLSSHYFQNGRRMGEQMYLFGVPDSKHTRDHFSKMTPEMKRASAHTAWGIYNWLV